MSNKLWFDQLTKGKNSLKDWGGDDMSMYSTYNEAKSEISEIFVTILKVKIYKKMAADNSNSYRGYLDELTDK